jgi:toxin secretion/phage lysis holin
MENIISTLKFLGYFVGMLLFAYLDIPQEQLAILGGLMIIDFVSGVAKQWRVDPTKITSKRAWLGVITKSASLSAVLTIALIIKGLQLDTSFYLSAMIGLLIMAEGYSILQNIYAVRTGKILPEYDVVSVILKSISGIIKDKIEKTLDSHK